jgi:hypothetical protein
VSLSLSTRVSFSDLSGTITVSTIRYGTVRYGMASQHWLFDFSIPLHGISQYRNSAALFDPLSFCMGSILTCCFTFFDFILLSIVLWNNVSHLLVCAETFICSDLWICLLI